MLELVKCKDGLYVCWWDVNKKLKMYFVATGLFYLKSLYKVWLAYKPKDYLHS